MMIEGPTFLRRFFVARREAQKQHHHWAAEDGSSILETAMSALIFLTFIFGTMEIALAAYTYHTISESAREGTRYAVVRGSTAGANCTAPGPPTCAAQSADITTYVETLGFPGINPANMTVTPTWSAFTSGSSCPATPPCNSPGNLVTIKVEYNYPLSIPFVSIKAIAMTSTSAMIISQ